MRKQTRHPRIVLSIGSIQSRLHLITQCVANLALCTVDQLAELLLTVVNELCVLASILMCASQETKPGVAGLEITKLEMSALYQYGGHVVLALLD